MPATVEVLALLDRRLLHARQAYLEERGIFSHLLRGDANDLKGPRNATVKPLQRLIAVIHRLEREIASLPVPRVHTAHSNHVSHF